MNSALFAVACCVAVASSNAAQQRSFVASDGSDVNNCTRSSPCRSFGAAIAQTLAGGEVIVLDSAGYGPVTITGPISIIAPAGVYAGISVSSGAGVTVNAAGTDVVALRGLDIVALAGASDGIVVQGGKRVVIDRCAVSGFSSGSALALQGIGLTGIDVSDSVLRDSQFGASFTNTTYVSEINFTRVRLEGNATGVSATGAALLLTMVDTQVQSSPGNGLHFNPAVGTVRFEMQRGAISGSNTAVNAAPTTSGAKVLGVVNEVLVADNSFGLVANAGAGATATLEVWNSVVRNNTSGIRAQQAGSTIMLRNNVIVDNGIGIQCVSCNGILTGGGNVNHDNATPGAPTGPVTTQ
jgi:hypothetical protein